MAQWGLDRRQFQMAEIESFEIWGAGQRSLTEPPPSSGLGSPSTMAADPFYESIDCPRFVDFTQPDSVREEDLEAWFEVYVDHEAGKPRSYPLFRDPAMDLALCELELERLLAATRLLEQLPPPQAPETPLHSRSSSSSLDSPPGSGRSCSPDSVLRSNAFSPHKSKALLDASRVDRLKGLLRNDLMSSKARAPSEHRAVSSGTRAYRPEPASAAPISSSASGFLKARRAMPFGRFSELGASESAEAGPSGAAFPVAVLPPIVPYQKHFTLDLLADDSECGPARDLRWQSPFPRTRRTTLRQPTAKPVVQSNIQTVFGKGAVGSVQPGSGDSQQLQFGDRRSGCDLQKVAERKARLREALRQKEGQEEMMWQQPAGPSHSERAMRTRYYEHPQAPWVLAL